MSVEFGHFEQRRIELQIPEGYQIRNLQDLRMKQVYTENGVQTMGFISDFSLNGNVLVIDIMEDYRNISYPVGQYEEFRKIINTSSDFNKVVLVMEENNMAPILFSYRYEVEICVNDLQITFLLLTGILIVPLVFGQNMDSVEVKTINRSFLFRDSVLNYEVKIPLWLHVRARSSASMFGGTLPAVNGIENAILISGYSKSAFTSFDDFKTFYLAGNTFGKPANFDREHIWYGQKDAINIDHGVKQRVFIFCKNRIYHDMFILL
jgi:hypothetical protein